MIIMIIIVMLLMFLFCAFAVQANADLQAEKAHEEEFGEPLEFNSSDMNPNGSEAHDVP